MKTIKTIRFNNQEISVIAYREKEYIPVIELCKALDVEYSKELPKINDHLIFKEVVHTIAISDRAAVPENLTCIEFPYVFGWLFSIDEKNGDTELVKLKLELYDLLADIIETKTIS